MACSSHATVLLCVFKGTVYYFRIVVRLTRLLVYIHNDRPFLAVIKLAPYIRTKENMVQDKQALNKSYIGELKKIVKPFKLLFHRTVITTTLQEGLQRKMKRILCLVHFMSP